MFFRRDDNDLAKKGVVNALLAFGYIIAIASFMAGMRRYFPDGDPVTTPIIVLSLLVLSAAVMASLIFGVPAMLYVDGKKKEALRLLGWTIGSLAVLTVGTILLTIAAAA